MDRRKELDVLYERIQACTSCELRESCTQPVVGLGDLDPKYMLIGEAPGREEDESGVPFVGAAGKKLNKLLAVANININDCYITNVVKCRPPHNRDPRKGEIAKCMPFLWAEIDLVKPESIITLGRIPLSLFSTEGIKKLHGTSFIQEGRRIIAQYHPAAAAHRPRLWAPMINDWEFLPEVHDPNFVVGEPACGKVYDRPVALDTENDEAGIIGEWSTAYRGEDGQLYVDSYYSPFDPPKDYLDKVIMHNAKYDLRILKQNRLKVPEPTQVIDTMIMAYCMGMGQQDLKDTGKSGGNMVGGLGLKYLARRHLGWQMTDWSKDIEDPKLYNAKDSAATYMLWEMWKDKVPQHFYDIDMPLMDVLMNMEDRGVQVDPDFLHKYMTYLDEQLANFDIPLNVNATQEIQSYVYGTLGIEPWKFTESGAPSVADDVLETIDDALIQSILEYKHLQHERNVYAGDYAKKIGPDFRLHTEFKQTSTATGRLSSARPNLQNISREKNNVYDATGAVVTTRNSELRKLFIAKPGYKLVVADFSQLELRVFAALTQDPVMLRIFNDPHGDIHQETADATGLARTDAKTINFLMVYEGSPWKISQEFHVPIDKAQQIVTGYYNKYQSIQPYHEHMKQLARTQQKVSNSFGRTRRLDAMFVPDRRIQREGEREAINMPVQADAADIVKIGMIDLHYKHHANLLLQVHDELVMEVPEAETKEYALWLKEYMPTIVTLNGVKFPVEVGYGDNWSDAKKMHV